ncbi:hypothetical protein TSUD_43930, partial [Trifolium subterraneum]
MFQENQYSALLAPSTSDCYIEDPSERSRISYTRKFLLSLAKVGDHRTLKLQREIRLKMSCVFENSAGLLPSPYCDQDSVCNQENRQDSAPKALDNVNFLHKSNEPYLPPCRNKALSSSSGDSNGSLSDNISGSSGCTSQEQAEPMIPDVQIQQKSELKSSNISLEDCSTCIPGLILPDEDSLITYDGPIWSCEAEIPDVIDSLMSTPDESNQSEDDFGRDQQDHNRFLRSSTDPAVYSLLSHHCPCHKIYQHSPLYDHGELKRFGLGAGESMFQQGKMQPQLPAFDKVASCKEKPNPMQNWFEYQGRIYGNSVNGHPDSHGAGNIDQVEVDKFADLEA